MSNSVVLTSTDENQSQEADSFDIQVALEELEKSLMYSVDQLAPAIESISVQLNRAAQIFEKKGMQASFGRASTIYSTS